jgi:hypothetical protein
MFNSKESDPFSFRKVGDALYLTPYIESGDLETAKRLAEVTEPLDGLGQGEQPQERTFV